MRDFRRLLGTRQRPSSSRGHSLAAIAIAALIASACGADQARPPQATDNIMPTSTPRLAPHIAGVSPPCAEAVLDYAEQGPVAVESIIAACATEAELSRAAHALDQPDISNDVASFIAFWCAQLEYPTGAPLCPPAVSPTPAPTPTPYVATIWEDDTFADHARALCEASRPRGLTSVTARVEPLPEPPQVAGIYLQIVSYTTLGGSVRPEPSLQRGYVYAIQHGSPVYDVTYPDDVDVIACVVLVATGAEQWYPSHQGGCPCDTYHAAEAFLWVIDAQGERIGAPWRRLPANRDNDERSEELIKGFNDGPGLRPPNQSDIIADLEALFGLEADA